MSVQIVAPPESLGDVAVEATVRPAVGVEVPLVVAGENLAKLLGFTG